MSAGEGSADHVLVLGGTGHIGAAIARRFAADGHRVTAVGRRAEPRRNLTGTRVVQIAGDDRDAANVEGWIAGASLVIDAGTPYPLWRHETRARQLVADARQRMTQILRACSAHGSALVHVSSFTTLPVNGSLQDRARVAAIRGVHPYFEVKETVERDVMTALGRGLQGCVVNPTACFGPYDLKPDAQAYIPMLIGGKVAGTLRHPVNIIDVRDVAACIAQSVRRGFPVRRLPLAGHNLSVDDLTRRICALAGVAPPALTAPLLPTVFASLWAESAAAFIGRQSPWPSLPLLLTAVGRAMTPMAGQRQLGLPLTPLENTLRDALDWYASRGPV